MAKNLHIKNKIREEAKLPPSMSWDAMEGKIATRLNELEGTAQAKGNTSNFAKRSLLVLLLLLVVAGSATLYYFIQKNPIENHSDTPSQSHQAIAQKQEKEHSLTLEKAEKNTPIKFEEKIIPPQKDNNVLLDKRGTINKQIKKASPKSLNNKLNKNTNTFVAVDDSKTTLDYLSAFDEKTISSSPTQQVFVESQGNATEQNLIDKNIVAVESADKRKLLSTQNLLLNFPPIENTIDETWITDKLNEAAISKPNIDLPTVPKWSLGLYSGATLWQLNAKGSTLGDEKAQFEKGIFSYGASAKIDYKLHSKWSLSTGLEWQSLQSKLDYYNEKDSIVTRNILTQQFVSPITGNPYSEVRQDVELVGIAWKEVIHYNNYQMLSIPVVINRHFHFSNKWNASIGTGLQYGRLLKLEGRSLGYKNVAEEITDIVDLQKDNFSKNQVAVLAQISLNYQINQYWSLTFSNRINQNLSNLNNTDTHTLRPSIMSNYLGLNYHF